MSEHAWSAQIRNLFSLQMIASTKDSSNLAKADAEIAEVEQRIEAIAGRMMVSCQHSACDALRAVHDILSIEALAQMREAAAPLLIGGVRKWLSNVAGGSIGQENWYSSHSILAHQTRYDPAHESFIYVGVSAAWCDFMGYSPEEAIGKPVYSFLTPRGFAKYEQLTPFFKKRGFFQDEVFEVRTKSGSCELAVISCIGEFDVNGQVSKGFAISRPIVSD